MISRVERYLEKNIIAVLVVLFVVSLILYLVVISYYVYSFRVEPISGKPSDWGVFGDYVGGVLNPFFAFMALIILIMTLRIQWQDAKESKRDSERSIIDSRFFQMVALHHNIVSDLKIYDKYGSVIASGRSCFEKIYGKVDPIMTMFLVPGEEQRAVAAEWEKIYGDYSAYLGHYFWNLYHIFRYIESLQSDVEQKNKEDYVRILRAQLSVYEIVLLFFNSLSEVGTNFKGIVERNALFNNLPVKELSLLNEFLFLYNISAYGDLPDKYSNIDFKKRKNAGEYLSEQINKAWEEKL